MSRGAVTLPGPGGVATLSSATQPGLSLALVDVHADLHHGGLLVALLTVAGETTLDIPALAVTTNPRGDTALVNVHTTENKQATKAAKLELEFLHNAL